MDSSAVINATDPEMINKWNQNQNLSSRSIIANHVQVP